MAVTCQLSKQCTVFMTCYEVKRDYILLYWFLNSIHSVEIWKKFVVEC